MDFFRSGAVKDSDINGLPSGYRYGGNADSVNYQGTIRKTLTGPRTADVSQQTAAVRCFNVDPCRFYGFLRTLIVCVTCVE